MLPLLLAAVVAVAGSQPKAESCETGCDERGCWLLVYRYTYASDERIRKVEEVFDGRRYPTEEAADCGAAEIRRTGVKLPTLERYGRDSNVMPELITPMPHLGALELGIRPAHPEEP